MVIITSTDYFSLLGAVTGILQSHNFSPVMGSQANTKKIPARSVYDQKVPFTLWTEKELHR